MRFFSPSRDQTIPLLFSLASFLACFSPMLRHDELCSHSLDMVALVGDSEPRGLRFCRVFGLLGVFRGGCLKSCTALVYFAVPCDAYASFGTSDVFAVYEFPRIVLLRGGGAMECCV
jgi:hypothetical protein